MKNNNSEYLFCKVKWYNVELNVFGMLMESQFNNRLLCDFFYTLNNFIVCNIGIYFLLPDRGYLYFARS